ncbi:MAG: AI-2E family transporter [Bacteroidetes bacterium]|nr:AI-2E family transporter [Bacteroidota bacterium]
MSELYSRYKLFFILFFIGVVGFLVWYFSQIVIFIIVAMVISIIGTPLVELLGRIRIGKLNFPHSLSVAVTLILMIFIVFGLFSFFIPLVMREASMISQIDTQKLIEHFQVQINWLQTTMLQYGIIPRGSTIESSLKTMVLKVIDFNVFSNILSSVISFTGSFFFNVFSILFLSFFFLYDSTMMPKLILLIIPEKYEEQTRNVMRRSKKLLSRYFIGMIIQILANILTYSIALLIVGVEGALVIAFFAGIIIIIPYLGGIIAVITGVLLGLTGVISTGNYDQIWPMAIKIAIAMLLVLTVDNNVFQPLIQGKSVKAHPVEIFLVVIAAASLGGIPGMIVAVPAYGFLKIVATEFLSNFRLIKEIKN